MSAQISFDTSERRLADKNAIKINTAQVESNISRSEGSPKKEIDTDKAQRSATVEPKTFPVESQTSFPPVPHCVLIVPLPTLIR